MTRSWNFLKERTTHLRLRHHTTHPSPPTNLKSRLGRLYIGCEPKLKKRMDPLTGVRKTVFSIDEMKGKSIVYITDVEGNYSYFEHVVSMSNGLVRTNEGKLDLLPDFHFVYGGDVCDRGKGDLRIAVEIVQLTKQYPGRVHIILGNRDINKIRLCTELRECHLKTKLHVFWVHGADIDEPDIAQGDPPCTPAKRLHSILECTMGAPEAFHHRVDELTELGIIREDMSNCEKDDSVVASYVSAVKPGGCYLELLQIGCLALLLGDVFFFHGGVHTSSLGWVPPSRTEGCHKASTVQEWCRDLAAFHHSEMKDVLNSLRSSSDDHTHGDGGSFRAFSAVGGYDHPEPGSRLMQYGMGALPDGGVNPTICYDNFLSQGAPRAPDDEVKKWLHSSGVTKTVTGHQPHGDAPVIIAAAPLLLLTGDTSYARNVEWDHSSFAESARLYNVLVSTREGADYIAERSAGSRGFAVAEIVIIFNEMEGGEKESVAGAAEEMRAQSNIIIHGVTQERFCYYFAVNEYVGRCAGGVWWVKTLFHLRYFDDGIRNWCDYRVYMISRSEGRRVFNALVTEENLKLLMFM